MAILAHAASAEDGSGFGRPGDQTGREVRMEPLGLDGNAWVWIYRYPDKGIAKNIAEANRQAAMNPCVGYSRETYTGWGMYYTRYGLWTAAHETGDIRKIDIPVNCDCSQLQITACWIAGVPGADKHRGMVTAIEDQTLTSLGFVKLPYKIEDTVDGDILLRPGHTGCVVEGWTGIPAEPTIKYRGRVTGLTPVFRSPRAAFDNLLADHPYLGEGNLVDVCDQTEGYFYVRIIDKYGYVPEDKIVRDDPEPEDKIKVGDDVFFKGGQLYISAGGGHGVEVPAFYGKVKAIMPDTFAYPYYVQSPAYDGWCTFDDLSKLS